MDDRMDKLTNSENDPEETYFSDGNEDILPESGAAPDLSASLSEAPEPSGGKKPRKKLSGLKKTFIAIGVLLAVILGLGTGLALYMLGGLKTDQLVARMDPGTLGANPGATTIVRGDGSDSTDTDESGSADKITLNESAANAVNVVLPEEVQVYIGDKKQTVSTLLPGAEQIKVFVMYGTDLSDLSDCNIITVLDPVHHKIKLISIARDSYVYYSDIGIYSKINHAYGWGGPALAIKTLNENFYLNIQDYIAVNWDQMQDIVNYLHGVWVYLDYDEWVAIGSPERYEYNQYVKLYGLAARKYAGLRSIDSDFHRMSRQREILTSMFHIAQNVKFSKYPSLIRYGLNMCTTSLDYSDILDMSAIMLDEDLTLEQYTFPPNDDTYSWGGFIDDVFYFVYDLDKASDEIYKIIYEDLYVSGYDEQEDQAAEAEPSESVKPSAGISKPSPDYSSATDEVDRPEDQDIPDMAPGDLSDDDTDDTDVSPSPEASAAASPAVSAEVSPVPSDGAAQSPAPSDAATASPSPSASPAVSPSPSGTPSAEASPSPSPSESAPQESSGFGSLVGF